MKFHRKVGSSGGKGQRLVPPKWTVTNSFEELLIRPTSYSQGSSERQTAGLGKLRTAIS